MCLTLMGHDCTVVVVVLSFHHYHLFYLGSCFKLTHN